MIFGPTGRLTVRCLVPEAMLGASGRLLEIPGELRELAGGVFRMRGPGGPAVARETRTSTNALGHEVYEIENSTHAACA